MHRRFRGIALLLLIILAVAPLLTACKAPEAEPDDNPQEATASPTPTSAPTQFQPTPDPTITPIVFDADVDWPLGSATFQLIDPITKPKRADLVFTPYELKTEELLGVSFEVPAAWEQVTDQGNKNAIVYQEPQNRIQSDTGVQSSITVLVSNAYSSQQTIQDAEAELDAQLDALRAEYTSLQVSSKATSPMMGKDGKYVTYWIDVPQPAQYNTDGTGVLKMRGRLHVVAIDRKIYTVRYICPAEYNNDYEKVYKQVRKTLKAL